MAEPNIKPTYFLFLIVILLLPACKKEQEVQHKPEPEHLFPNVLSVPLQIISQANPSPLFNSLEPKSIGIDFLPAWNPPDKYKVMIARETAGGGVGIGDVNGDGLPDIVFSQPFGGVKLYKNLGDFKFSDATARSGLASDKLWCTGVSLADIDSDGDLDLALCGFDVPCRIYQNDGSGNFTDVTREVGLPFKGATVQLAFADIDLDGDLDAFLSTNRYSISGNLAAFDTETQDVMQRVIKNPDGTVKLPRNLAEKFSLINKGDGQAKLVKSGQFGRMFLNEKGKFRDITPSSGIVDNGLCLAACWWDANQDGLPDLYLANDFYGPDRLFVNQGNNQFKDLLPELLPHTPWFSMGADSGDINNDGRVDFFASDMSGSTHYKSKMMMGDPKTDAWFLDSAFPHQYMRNAMYLNTGENRMMEIAHFAGISGMDWIWSPRLADFDNDGWIDLYVTNGMSGDWANTDLIEKLKDLPLEQALSEMPRKPDINRVFRNSGGLHFEDTSLAWGLGVESVSFGSATGDLDGDGDLDIVVNNFDSPPFVYRNDSPPVAQRVTIRLKGTTSNSWGIGARVEAHGSQGIQTRYLTLARGYISTSQPIVHFGTGSEANIEKLVIYWPSGIVQELKNLPSNYHHEITEPAESLKTATEPTQKKLFAKQDQLPEVKHKETKFDDFIRQPLLPNKQSQYGPGMAIADVNGDGIDDLFLGAAAGDTCKLLLGDGKGGFKLSSLTSEETLQQDSQHEDMGCLFFDADSDGDADLYVVSGGNECDPDDDVLADRLYLNDGSGNFVPAKDSALPIRHESGSCVCATDFDHDGDLDLFVGGRAIPGRYPIAARSVLLRNDSTTESVSFTDVSEQWAPFLKDVGIVNSATWTDIDGNQQPDLILAREWNAPAILVNRDGVLEDITEAAGIGGHKGWWNSIVTGDFDGDGDFDFAAGNFGLNSKYHPKPGQPVRIYYGEMDDSGLERIVEAKFDTKGVLLPVRGKG